MTRYTDGFWRHYHDPRAPRQYTEIRLKPKSRKVSKPRDWGSNLSNCSHIWQASPQQRCGAACQILEPSDNYKYWSRDFEISWDLGLRRICRYWRGAQQKSPAFFRVIKCLMRVLVRVAVLSVCRKYRFLLIALKLQFCAHYLRSNGGKQRFACKLETV